VAAGADEVRAAVDVAGYVEDEDIPDIEPVQSDPEDWEELADRDGDADEHSLLDSCPAYDALHARAKATIATSGGDCDEDVVQEAAVRKQIALLQRERGRRFDVVISGDGGWKQEWGEDGVENVVTFAWLAGFSDGTSATHFQRLLPRHPERANNYDGEVAHVVHSLAQPRVVEGADILYFLDCAQVWPRHLESFESRTFEGGRGIFSTPSMPPSCNDRMDTTLSHGCGCDPMSRRRAWGP
jgi:hypothetical protein